MKSASMYDMYPLIGATIALYHTSIKLQNYYLKSNGNNSCALIKT